VTDSQARSGPPPVESLVVAVILNTNRRDDTLECLESLMASTHRTQLALVLDNQSTDGSVPAIHTRFPSVEVIELRENKGYAGNNNVGIQAALERGADWVFVLNEDTVLAPTCVRELLSVANADASIGIVGPLVYHHDEPRVIQSAGGGLSDRWEGFHHGQNEPDIGRFQEPHSVQWITGCGILVRRAVIEQIGGIDERFFIYWEETEWCLRARKAGWRIVQVPAAKMWHKGVQRVYRPKPSVTYYATRNRLLMLLTHRAPFGAWVAASTQLLRTLASWTLRPKWRSQREHRDAMWHGVKDFLHGRWGPMSR
jgi:GT2 family glycosyltransferase